jgi:hypothetical protein
VQDSYPNRPHYRAVCDGDGIENTFFSARRSVTSRGEREEARAACGMRLCNRVRIPLTIIR